MKARRHLDDDDNEEDGYDDGEVDWQPDGAADDDEEPEDSNDSDYGYRRTVKKTRKAATPKLRTTRTPARRTPQKSRRRASSYSEDSEGSAADSESDDDDGGWDGAAVRSRAAARPRRQAAQRANANIKHTYQETDEEGAYNTANQYTSSHAAGHDQQGYSYEYSAAAGPELPAYSHKGYYAIQEYAGYGVPANGYAAAANADNYAAAPAANADSYDAGSADAAGGYDADGQADLRHDADADYQYAQQMQEEWNGLRTRAVRSSKARTPNGSQSPPVFGRAAGSKRSSAAAQGGGRSLVEGRLAKRQSGRSVAKVSYAESGQSESDEGGGRGNQARREPVPAFEDWGADGVEQQQLEIERVLGHRDMPGDPAGLATSRWSTAEFHVKWKGRSYTHCTWERLDALKYLPGFKRVTNYCKRIEQLDAAKHLISREELELQDVQRQMEEQLVEQYQQVERVVAERPGHDRCLLVKWEGLPYCECTWEAEGDVMAARGGPQARDEFLTRQQRLQEPSKGVDAARNAFIASKQVIGALAEQPEYLAGGNLRDYQLDGLNWLTYAWIKDRNCILADEMGLGKTVQCVSFLGLLAETCGVRGPFLVVVPLSTVPNWIREFRRWVPQLNSVVYVGDGRSREVVRAFEFSSSTSAAGSNRSRPYAFEVLITTYELGLKDAELLGKVHWAYLMVDEAHRLKNSESALYQELATWSFKNKLLVTGTPLQNSLRELWALLHFLEPRTFNSFEAFEAAYSLDNTEQVSQLHGALKPHLLRRVIKDVEKSLPPKNERILRLEMTPLQCQYYKWILARNFKELNKGARGQVSLLNIITELKKACNHPFLFESAEDEYRGSEGDKSVVDRLILTSGKMVLLDKLLRRLRETGHRVLVFSQMVRVLDIISDYMRLRGYPHQRLDGSTPAAQRAQAMEAFNRPDSLDFAFLLSTRAGGLGINLATADTVVIFDSDWNPQNDLQAMSRAHRIGQTETVNIYRLVTSGSVEEEILERAKRKMVLDHLVIQRMDTSGRTVLDSEAGGGNRSVKAMFNKDELAAILRFGAEDLFKAAEEGSAERSRRLLEDDIDAILERAEVVDTRPAGAGGEGGAEGAAADLLSSFNVATFKSDEDDATFWSRLIREADRPPEVDEPLGPRAARLTIATAADNTGRQGSNPLGIPSRSLSGTPQLSDNEHEHGRSAGQQRQQKKAKGAGATKRRAGSSSNSSEPGPPVDGALLRVDQWLPDVCEEHPGAPLQAASSSAPATRPLSRRDAAAFVRAVRRYGLQSRLPSIAAEVGGVLKEVGLPEQRSLWRGLVEGCKRVLDMAAEAQQQDGKDPTLDFFGCAVKAGDLTHHLSCMALLESRVIALKAAQQDPATSFRLEAATVPPAVKWGKAIGWTPRDDAALLLGVYYYGLGHWEAVIRDPALGLSGKLACVLAGKDDSGAAAHSMDKALMPKASHLETRVLGILRKMHANSSKAASPAQGAVAAAFSSQGKQQQQGYKALGSSRPPAGPPAHTVPHLPPKKAAKARAAAFAAVGFTQRAAASPPPAAAAPLAAAADQLPASQQQSSGPPAGTHGAARNGSALQKGAQMDSARGTLLAANGAAVAAHDFTSAATADHSFKEHLKTVAANLDSLLQLNTSEDRLEPKQVMALTKKHLLAVGQAVDRAVAANVGLKQSLWHYVVSYIKTPLAEEKIISMYNRLNRAALMEAALVGPAQAAAPAAALAAGPAASTALAGIAQAVHTSLQPPLSPLQQQQQQGSRLSEPAARCLPPKKAAGTTTSSAAAGGMQQQHQQLLQKQQQPVGQQQHAQQQAQQQQVVHVVQQPDRQPDSEQHRQHQRRHLQRQQQQQPQPSHRGQEARHCSRTRSRSRCRYQERHGPGQQHRTGSRNVEQSHQHGLDHHHQQHHRSRSPSRDWHQSSSKCARDHPQRSCSISNSRDMQQYGSSRDRGRSQDRDRQSKHNSVREHHTDKHSVRGHREDRDRCSYSRSRSRSRDHT